jgi:hypothetical protein
MKTFSIPNSFLLALCLALPSLTERLAAQGTASPPKFGPKWKVLIGEWKGESQSSTASGECGFHFDLSDHVIVRTNHAVLPGSSGSVHNDLMVISPEPTEDRARASYFDNEGHVIEYAAAWTPDGDTLTFLSKPAAGPQFRLTYKKLDANTFTVVFDMAAPGQPAAFRTYTSGKIIRSSTK